MLHINLLPPKQPPFIFDIRSGKKWFITTGIITTLFLIIWQIKLQQKLSHKNQELASLSQKYKLLQTKKAPYTQTASVISKQTKYYEQLKKRQEFINTIFQSLHRGINNALHLTHFSLDNNEINITGAAHSLYAITHLATTLANNNHLGTPRIYKITRQNTGYEFSWSWIMGANKL